MTQTVRLAINRDQYHDLAKQAESPRGVKTSVSKELLSKLLVDNNRLYRACLDSDVEIIEP